MHPAYYHGHGHSHSHHPVSISPITPTILLGDVASSISIPTLIHYSITAMVSLGLRPCYEWSRPGNRKLVPERNHLFVVCDDSPTQDLLCRMSEICDFIDQQTEPPDLLSLLEQAEEESMRLGGACIGDGPLSIGMEQGKVLVHCTQGVSRSPTVVIAYLMRKQRRGFEAVYADVKVKRREIEPSENFVQQLRIWEEVGYEVWEDKGRTKPKRAYQAFLDKTARMVEEEDEGNYHGGW